MRNVPLPLAAAAGSFVFPFMLKSRPDDGLSRYGEASAPSHRQPSLGQTADVRAAPDGGGQI
eukprot:COSAG05_NODE_16487_length_345_cov_0.626016_2_plen_61_part_01